ncbi:MAG: hypothetical protein RSE41_10860 [Clostridia bacterium]
MKTGINKTNIISYRTINNKGKERGFLSFEGTLSPASLFLKKYIEETKLDININQFVKERLIYWQIILKLILKIISQ